MSLKEKANYYENMYGKVALERDTLKKQREELKQKLREFRYELKSSLERMQFPIGTVDLLLRLFDEKFEFFEEVES